MSEGISRDLPVHSTDAFQNAPQAQQTKATEFPTVYTINEYRSMIAEAAEKRSIPAWRGLLALLALAAAFGVFGKGFEDHHLGKILGGGAGMLAMSITIMVIIKHNVGVSNTADRAREKLDALSRRVEDTSYAEQAEKLAKARAKLAEVIDDIQTTPLPSAQKKSQVEKEKLEKEIQTLEGQILEHYMSEHAQLQFRELLRILPK